MECNKEEAMRAKASAEDLMVNNDFVGAHEFLIKAQGLFSGLESLPQMLAICDVHSAADEKINNLDNWYGILQVMHFVDDATIKKQYRKLALLLHPDKNHFPGAEPAFKLIVQATGVLAHKERRLQYDTRYRYHSRLLAKQLNVQRGSTNNASNTVVNNGTFWTCCEHCGYRYKYLAEYVNFLLFCSTCQRSFMAYNTGFDAVPPKSSTDQNQGPCNTSLHRNVAAEDGHVKNYAYVLNPQSKFTEPEMDASKSVPGESVSRSDQAPSMRKSKRRKFVEEPSESINVDVSDTVEHIVDSKDKNRRKSRQKSNADEGSSDNHQARGNPIVEDSPDPDFNHFEPTTSCFAVNQVWSLYDPTDGMPRFYARINKVVHSEFKLWITWMYPLRDNKDSSIPIACGIFQDGESEEVADHLIFSSKMLHLTRDNDTIIYPRRGEVWGLFRGWDISWDSTLENHKPPYEYDYVEILSDFNDEDGVGVAYLGKMEGFASLFCQNTQRGVLQHQIPPSELLRFSHKAPSFKITGKEREGVPPGCFELNTAASPKYLFEVDNSGVDVELERNKLNGGHFREASEVEVQVKTTRNKHQKVHDDHGPFSKTSGGICTNGEVNSRKKFRKSVNAVDDLKLRKSPRLLNNSRVDVEIERNKVNGGHSPEASEVGVQEKTTRNKHQKDHEDLGPSSKTSGGICTDREMNSRKKSRESVKAVDDLKLRKSSRLLNITKKQATSTSRPETAEKKKANSGESHRQPDEFRVSSEKITTDSSRIRKTPWDILEPTGNSKESERNGELLSQSRGDGLLTRLNGNINCSVPETHVPSSCTLNFENQRSWDKFQVNQVWAIYSNANGMPRTYAQIKKIDTSPEFKVHVAPLELYRPAKSLHASRAVAASS